MNINTLIDVNSINELPVDYENEFKEFCKLNDIKLPNIYSGTGIALSVMVKYKFYYWNRDTCDLFVKKFNIKTKDSIQLFNKHSQRGIKTNSGLEKGKLYIVYPYTVSNKYKIRKNINTKDFDKDREVEKIKSTIKNDYIDQPNSFWQLGHKNPSINKDDGNNLVLQPPIQSKYRDEYIFIDTLTKFPLPKKLESMIIKKEIRFTKEQIESYMELFTKFILE